MNYDPSTPAYASSQRKLEYHQPSLFEKDVSRKPFERVSALEIIAAKESTRAGIQVNKASVVCTFLICNLPFDC